MRKVLLVEDDISIADLLKIHLTDLGCEVSMAHDGEIGLDMALNNVYDLMILDVMLPRVEGLEICRQVRGKENNTPVLMLTAKSEELDKVLGLEIGADDYMTKPFSVREFIARVKAIFRRARYFDDEKQKSDTETLLSFDELSIDFEKRVVALHKERVDLSPKEFELLKLLASNPGKSFSRTQLLRQIWGYDFDGYEHTVNSHINRLRMKIEPDINTPKYILTTWGVGYRFMDA